MSTVVNYAKKWNFKSTDKFFKVEGTYVINGQPMFFNDEERKIVEEENKGEPIIINEGGWEFLIYKNEEKKTATMYICDTGRDNEDVSDDIMRVVCEQADLAFTKVDINDVIVTYAKQASPDEADVTLAIASLIPEISSILVFLSEGDYLMIKDVKDNVHKLGSHCVPMIGRTVYDIQYGYLGINVYEYIERLYSCNEANIGLIEGPTGIVEAVADTFTDTEWSFWETLMKPELYSEGRDKLKEVIKEVGGGV